MLNAVFSRSRHVSPRIPCHLRQFASAHSRGVHVGRLEVERKFLVTPVALSYLRSNGEGPGSGFGKYESLGKQSTHDIYFDKDGLLFARGVYVRLRNGHWEAKIRTGGDFINSAFTEIDGNDAVREVVARNLAVAADGVNIENTLKPCAEFVTDRESWTIDGKFQVDVDTTDFGHTVGEVELTEVLRYNGVEHGGEEELREKMDQEIKAFMQSYPQAFPTGRPVGKLSAYFQKICRET